MDRPPPDRRRTVREAIVAALRHEPLTLLELSGIVGVREKDLPGHLEHLRRSLKREGGRLIVEPARCVACDHTFTKRTRFTKPGRCPRCRSERIEPPRVGVE